MCFEPMATCSVPTMHSSPFQSDCRQFVLAMQAATQSSFVLMSGTVEPRERLSQSSREVGIKSETRSVKSSR